MNRRNLLASLSALPALLASKVASAAPSPMPATWEALERHACAYSPSSAAPEIRAAILRAYRAGFDHADCTGFSVSVKRGDPFALHFGDWTAGTFATVEASRVLRWNVEGPAERWG